MTADPNALATANQVNALKKFGCEVPDGLRFSEASEWMNLLVTKKKAGQTITDLDRSGPPGIHPAGKMPTATPPAAPATPPVPPNGTAKETFVQIAGWVPADRVGIVVEAIKQARKDVVG